jgi:hypothetical protein
MNLERQLWVPEPDRFPLLAEWPEPADFVEKLGLSLGVDHDSPWLGTGSGDPR